MRGVFPYNLNLDKFRRLPPKLKENLSINLCNLYSFNASDRNPHFNTKRKYLISGNRNSLLNQYKSVKLDCSTLNRKKTFNLSLDNCNESPLSNINFRNELKRRLRIRPRLQGLLEKAKKLRVFDNNKIRLLKVNSPEIVNSLLLDSINDKLPPIKKLHIPKNCAKFMHKKINASILCQGMYLLSLHIALSLT